MWLILSSTCHFLTDNSLQSADKDQQEMRAVAEKLHNAVVKFDMYRNVQQHHAVHPAIARLLFLFLRQQSLEYMPPLLLILPEAVNKILWYNKYQDSWLGTLFPVHQDLRQEVSANWAHLRFIFWIVLLAHHDTEDLVEAWATLCHVHVTEVVQYFEHVCDRTVVICVNANLSQHAQILPTAYTSVLYKLFTYWHNRLNYVSTQN